ncbi:MAG: hypothetical protein JWR03_2733 [Cohnella sp.]|nr:hypothetical protein [Cohnella sp.]
MYTTPDEAKASFGQGFLIPSYTPGRVALSGIQASGHRQESATKVVLSYVYGEISFMVIEEKDTSTMGLHHFKSVDVNGAPGYLKTGESDTELHWITNGAHYVVTGQIKELEAMKVAKSMK